MKYIITGGTGHIGNNLIRELLKDQNNEICVLVRRKNDESLRGLKVKEVIGDILDANFLSQVIEKNSTIVHIAGLIDITNKELDNLIKVNYEATKKIIDVSIKNKASKFIYVSSVDAIYKENNIAKIIEPTDLYPDKLKTYYGKSKALATKYVLEKLENEIKGAVIYPSAVIGPNDYKISSAGTFFLNSLEHKMMARIKGEYNFVDVRDVAKSIIFIATNETLHKSYLITGSNISVNEIFKTIYKYQNRKRLPIYLPLWFVYFISFFVPLVAKIKKEKPVFTKMAIDILNDNHNYDNSLSVKDLKMNYIDVKKSIIDSLDWLKKHKVKRVVKKATKKDVDSIMDIIADAKDTLKSHNIPQWNKSYPSKEDILKDIKNKVLYVIKISNEIVGVFAIYQENNDIYKLDDFKPIVIHKTAVKKEYYGLGIMDLAFEFILKKYKNEKYILIDTHRKNHHMQNVILRNGFKEEKIIYLEKIKDEEHERILYKKENLSNLDI